MIPQAVWTTAHLKVMSEIGFNRALQMGLLIPQLLVSVKLTHRVSRTGRIS